MPDKKTILLVEDESIIRLHETSILKEQGYDVIGASTGEKAIGLLTEGNHVDLILMDINLGKGMDGTQAAQEILKEHDIPIVFLSVHTETDIVEKTKGITSYGYVVKDSGKAVLDASIKMALNLYEARKELARREETLREELAKRKSAESAFRLAEGGFRKLYETMRDAYVAVDMKGKILQCNSAYRDLVGYSDEEIAGLTYMDLTPEEWHGPEAEIIRDQVMVRGYSSVYEKEYRRKDGTIVPVELRAVLIRDEDGSPTGMWGVVRDITERKKAENELIESEGRYRTAIEASNDGVVLVKEGNIVHVNQRFLEIFGYKNHGDVVGKSAYIVVHPDDRVMVKDYNRLRQLGERVPTRYEFKGLTKDEKIIFIEISLSNIVFKGQSTRLVFLRDITRRKKAEEGWKLDESRLESLLAISQFKAGSVRELLDFALEQAIRLTRSRIGYIYLYDEQTKQFTLNTWSKEVMNECRIANPETIYHLDKTGVWGEAVRQRRAIILNDFKAPHLLKKGHPEGHAELNRFLTIPVIVQKKIVAVVGVANKASDYDQSDARQLTLLMNSTWQLMEHKRAEEKVTKAAEEWRTTFDAIREPVMLLDRNFKITRANKATAAFLDLPIDGVPGNHCYTLMHETSGQVGECPFARMAHTNTHEEEEFYFGKKKVWLSVSVDPIMDKNGEMTGAVHIARDITQRKEAEEVIKKSEEKYRNIFENAIEGIFQVSPEGKFISVNSSFARMHGFDSPEQLLIAAGDVASQLYKNPDDLRRYLKTLHEHGLAKMHEVEMRRKDGTIIWVSLSARGVRDESGKILYYEGTVADITARKTAELSLTSALTELESKNRDLEAAYVALKESQKTIFQQEKMASIGQLAAGVAHEINNPMGFIMSNLNSLQRYMKRLPEFIEIQSRGMERLVVEPSEGESILHGTSEAKRKLKIDYILGDAQSLINESLEGADRVKRIVQDLKSFSRVDDEQYKLSDINKIIDSTLNIVWNEIKYKATVNKEYGEAGNIRCNPGQLGQVFMNILVNAAQAISESGQITIKTWQNGASVYVAISDTGSGIPPEQFNRIFEPFFTTKDIGKGTGLGLSIVYDIVQKHKGEIRVESEVGKGTTFTLIIPLEGEENG